MPVQYKSKELCDMIKLVEVGPRDGLQNEQDVWTVEDRCQLIRDLSACGLRHIEVGAMVSPQRVPSMARSEEVLQTVLAELPHIDASVLVPNLRGLERAVTAGAKHIATFVAASEGFSLANNRQPRDKILHDTIQLIKEAKMQGLRVRSYVSCVVHCPFDGWIDPTDVQYAVETLLDAGSDEISLGDTTGYGTVPRIRAVLQSLREGCPIENIAVHFHDTYGQALLHCAVAHEMGVRIFDSSIAGLGGCPFAPGAAGNLATEYLVHALQGINENMNLDLNALQELSGRIKHRRLMTNNSDLALEGAGIV